MEGPQCLKQRISSRGFRLQIMGWLLALLVPGGAVQGAGPQEAASGVPLPWFEDAQLNDLAFVDAQTGWAVGDRGVIWHTSDGGASWQRQESGVDCRLEAVFFLNKLQGWAVGGRSRPGTPTSQGVLLRTRNGGQSWQADRRLMLPSLAKVGFFDEARGWVAGDTSALFGSGVFTTQDGGRSWVPWPTTIEQTWTTADFIDETNGALAGTRGATAVARRQAIELARTAPLGHRTLRDLKLRAPTAGWLVGEGGLVLLTDDLGRTWQTPLDDLPDGMASMFHFQAVEARGDRCWVVGAPGTRVLHTANGGRSWEGLSTGQTAPLRAICFVDEQRGWAAGIWGTILATRDGGQTWQRQRSGGTRAAVLGIYGEARHLPFEALARLAGNEGYLTAIELLNRRQGSVESRAENASETRAREALMLLGGSSVNEVGEFPLPATGQSLAGEQLITAWNRANDGRGLERMLEHVVRQIRTWRPEIVLTHAASLRGGDPQSHLINQVVLRAVEQAADPTAFPEQQIHAGLEPWQVKKIFGELPQGTNGSLVVHASQFAPRLGRSLADLAAASRVLVDEQWVTSATDRSFRAYIDRLPQERGQGDFMTGITLHPGGEARRILIEPDGKTMENLRRSAQRQRNLEAILEQTSRADGGGGHLLGEIESLTADWGQDQAGQLLYQLALQYQRAGQWDMAAETWQLLADKMPEHRLAPAALSRLIQSWASGEVTWRMQQTQRVDMQTAAGNALAGREATPGATSSEPGAPYAVRQASTLGIDWSRQTDRAARAVALGAQLEQLAPAVHAEPAVGFPLALAQREQGAIRLAGDFMIECVATVHDAWWAVPNANPGWSCARVCRPNPSGTWRVPRSGLGSMAS